MTSQCNGDAAVYVLGALEEHEVPAFAEHMNSCTVCREEVLSMQLVVDLLPATVPALAAPAALKRRVLSAVATEASLERAVSEAPSARGRRRPFAAFSGAFALAATAAAAVFLAFSGSLSGGTTHGGASAARVVTAHVSSDAATGRAALHESGSRNELVVSRMPPPPAGHIYQVWLSRRGQPQPAPTNALFNVAADGSATVDVPGSLRGVKAVLVTAEPLGGSRVPSSVPIITASLT